MIFPESTGIGDNDKYSCLFTVVSKAFLLRFSTFLDFLGADPNSWTVKLPPDETNGKSVFS